MSTEAQKVDVLSIRDRARQDIHGFTFGPLHFEVKGSGVFFMSDRLKERIAAMSLADLKAANGAAWKMKRSATRKANAYCNVTRYGCRLHDDACFMHDVADAVRKVTWEALARIGGAA